MPSRHEHAWQNDHGFRACMHEPVDSLLHGWSRELQKGYFYGNSRAMLSKMAGQVQEFSDAFRITAAVSGDQNGWVHENIFHGGERNQRVMTFILVPQEMSRTFC